MKTNATREQIQNFIKNINEYLGDDIVWTANNKINCRITR
jgi:hypothetical protein